MVFGLIRNKPADTPMAGVLPYRMNVGFVLVNPIGKVFLGKRADKSGPDDGWQLPQGGIDSGESPTEALWRELGEEVGTTRAELVASYPRPMSYDFPDAVRAKVYDGRYRGQTQYWFLLRFVGDDGDINIHHAERGQEPEFSDYAWCAPQDVINRAVTFKKTIYENVLYYFDEYIAFRNR
jgi:putative (di)nucleoside polyphosphate hydrolase